MTRQNAIRRSSCCVEFAFFLLLLFIPLDPHQSPLFTLITLVEGVSSSSWIDGELVTSPQFECDNTPVNLPASSYSGVNPAILFKHDYRSQDDSQWFISCWNSTRLNEGNLGYAFMLYQGTLQNFTRINFQYQQQPWSSINAGAIITTITQPQGNFTNTNGGSASSDQLYMLAVDFTGTISLLMLDLTTLILTSIQMPLASSIDPFTLIQINETIIFTHPTYPELTLISYDFVNPTWSTVGSTAQYKCAHFSAMTYDSISQSFTAACGNALYTCTLNETLVLSTISAAVLSDRDVPSVVPDPPIILLLLTCNYLLYANSTGNSQQPYSSTQNHTTPPTGIYYLRTGQQLFMIQPNRLGGNDILTAWIDPYPILLNGTGKNGTTTPEGFAFYAWSLLDSMKQPNLCRFQSTAQANQNSTYLRPNILQWNDARQTLYIGCTSGSASALAIQSIPQYYGSSNSPVITSLISSDVCSQVQVPIGIATASSYLGDVTLILSCSEGIYSTSGRSLYSIGRVLDILPVLLPNGTSTLDTISPSIFLSSSQSTLYSLSALQLTSLISNKSWWCPTLSVAASSYISNVTVFAVVCSQWGTMFPFPLLTQIFIPTNTDGMPVSLLLYTAPIKSNQTEVQQTTFATSFGFYLLHAQQICYWPTWNPNLIFNGFPQPQPVTMVNNSGVAILNENIDALQVVEELIGDGSMIVSWISNSTFYVYIAMVVSQPAIWRPMHELYTTNITVSSSFLPSIAIESFRQRFWILLQTQLVMIDFDVPNQSFTFGPPSVILSAFTVDSQRSRVFVAWYDSSSSSISSSLSIVNSITGTIISTVSPATSSTPYIRSMLVSQITSSLILLVGSMPSQQHATASDQSTQIVVYTDQWTCAAGLQWVDGSCQPCGVSTSRGFISYPDALQSIPQCDSCPPGMHSNISGLSQCLECAAGRYSLYQGAIMCDYCQPNQFNNQSGSRIPCNNCTSGTSASDPGSTNCSPCALGSFTTPGSPCVQCPVNTYSPSPAAGCLLCSDAGQEGLSCSFGHMNVKAGWWAYVDPNDSTKYLTAKCPPGYCIGVRLNFQQDWQNIQCYYPRDGRTDNWICANCVDGHIPWGSECQWCPTKQCLWFIGFVIIAILIVIFLMKASSTAGPLTILVYFTQIAALELGPISDYFDWIQFANFSLLSIRWCILPIMPLAQNTFNLLIPLMFLLILTVIGRIHRRFSLYFSSRDTAQSNSLIRVLGGLTRDFSVDRYLGHAMSILIFCYTPTTIACLQSLYCVSIGPGVNRLFSAPSIDCTSSEYKDLLLPLAIFVLVVYVIGFPFAMLIFLWRSSSKIQHLDSPNHNHGQNAAAASPALQKFISRWSPFILPYRSATWYWQPLSLLRRLIFALISVLALESPLTQATLYGSFGLCTLLLQQYHRPFATPILNNLESIGQVLLISITYIQVNQPPPYQFAVGFILSLFVLPFFGILMAFIVVDVARAKNGGRMKEQRPTAAQSGQSIVDIDEEEKSSSPRPLPISSHAAAAALRVPLLDSSTTSQSQT